MIGKSFVDLKEFRPTDTALVTGASSGLGKAFAIALAESGIGNIVLVARRKDKLDKLARNLGCPAIVMVCDLTNRTERENFLAKLPDIDILINNAGFGLRGKFGDQSADDIKNMIELHVNATVDLCHTVIINMRRQKRGFILNVGSCIGEVSLPNSAMYCATKSFINNFTETIRMEEKRNGISVLLLAPGPIKTEFFSNLDPPRIAPGIAMTPSTIARKSIELLQYGTPLHMPDWKIRLIVSACRHLPKRLIFALIYRLYTLRTAHG